MENNVNSEKKNIGLIILIIGLSLLVVGLGGYIAYDKFFTGDEKEEKNEVKEDEKVDSTDDKKEEEKKDSIVPIEDTFALSQGHNGRDIELYLVSDGNLYYGKFPLDYSSRVKDQYGEHGTNEMKLVNGISNVKRVVGTNTMSSGDSFNVLAITEDGNVYVAYVREDNGEMATRPFISNQNIDDIIEMEWFAGCISEPGVEPEPYCGSRVIAKFLDGTTGEVDLH